MTNMFTHSSIENYYLTFHKQYLKEGTLPLFLDLVCFIARYGKRELNMQATRTDKGHQSGNYLP